MFLKRETVLTRLAREFRPLALAALLDQFFSATNRRTIVESGANYFRNLAKRANFVSGRQLSGSSSPFNLSQSRILFNNYYYLTILFEKIISDIKFKFVQ